MVEILIFLKLKKLNVKISNPLKFLFYGNLQFMLG